MSMNKVMVKVNGRNYPLVCEPERQDYVRDLSKQLDERLQGLAKQFGQVGDAHLLLIAGITLCDELQNEKAGNANKEIIEQPKEKDITKDITQQLYVFAQHLDKATKTIQESVDIKDEADIS